MHAFKDPLLLCNVLIKAKPANLKHINLLYNAFIQN